MHRDKWDKLRHIVAVKSGARRVSNHLRYGADAPRPHQRITIVPADLVTRYAPTKNSQQMFPNRFTGCVIDGDWDQKTGPLNRTSKFKACQKHFQEGLSWEKTTIIAQLAQRIAKSGPLDGCSNRADLIRRYNNLDHIWEISRLSNALPPDADTNTDATTGILVHIRRDGIPIFGNQGFHRVAIAQLLQIPQITVIIGVVHPEAVRSGAYARLLGR